MGSSLRFFREWYLGQIVFSLMRIIDSRIQTLFFLLLSFFNSSQRIALFICHSFEAVCPKDILYNSLIITLPIINIFALTPQTLETLLSLQYCLRIIEIPCCRTSLIHIRNRHSGGSILVEVAVVRIFLLKLCNLCFCFQCLLFFLLLSKFFYHPINSSISRIFIHNRKFEKRVLQLYSISKRHQLIEHL